MEQAIELAKQNHPRLKIASAAIRQVKAGRGEVLELSPTEMNYSWGQLNGELRKDKQWEVTQGLGSLLTPFYKNALVNRQVETGTFYRQIAEKEVVAEVKRAWAYYLYACNLRALYSDQNKLAGQLQRMGELRYQQGEITLLEKNMTTSMAVDMKNRLFQVQEEEKLALSRLNWVCYADRPLIPADTALVLFPVDYQVPSFSEVHLNYFQSQANEAKAQLNVERSRFFPELSFGYVRQDILPLKGLNSWMVGVSFPVYFLPRHSKIKQAKVAAVIARTEAEANTQNLYNKVSEAVASLRRQSESLRYYTTSALKEADELLKVANLQLQHSETNITEFIQAVNVARDIRRGYLETVYQYNIEPLNTNFLNRMMTMKKITFPLILLVLTACGENKEVQPAEEATAVVVAENVTDSIQVDAITSATSKPNQVSFNGTMVIPPQRMATVSLTMGGVIKSTSLLPGEPVRQGSVLATLENPDFITLQQTYLDSHAQTEFLEAEYLRQQALSAEQAASQKKLQQSKADYLSMKSRVEAAAAQLKLLEVEPEVLLKEGIQPFLQIKAPISGYVADVKMNVGKYMNVGDALCEIVDKSRTLLRLTTYEKDLADMKVGNPVQFRVNGMGKIVFKATLISIGQKVDEDTRSVEVYARVDTVDNQFRPGMYVTARIMKEQASAEQ